MSEEWVETTVGEIVTIKAGKYVPKSEYVEDAPYFIYGSNSIMGKYDKWLVESPHVVMAAVGAYAGASRFSSEPSWVNNNAFALMPTERIHSFFLYLWLDSVLELPRILAGTGQPYVKRPSLLAQKVLLPPLPVQRRIVDLMTHLDAHIANLQAEGRAIADVLASLGQQQWEGCESRLRLADTGKVTTGMTPSTKNDTYWQPQTVPFVTPADVSTIGFVDKTSRFISEDGLSATRPIDAGSVVVVCIGATLGKVGLARSKCGMNQQLNAISGLDANDALYLLLIIGCESGTSALWERAGKTALPLLNKTQFGNVEVPWPAQTVRENVGAATSRLLLNQSSLRNEADDLERMRSILLMNLLQGAFGLPPSYDYFLDEAA